jgi:hypothetical protein
MVRVGHEIAVRLAAATEGGIECPVARAGAEQHHPRLLAQRSDKPSDSSSVSAAFSHARYAW